MSRTCHGIDDTPKYVSDAKEKAEGLYECQFLYLIPNRLPEYKIDDSVRALISTFLGEIHVLLSTGDVLCGSKLWVGAERIYHSVVKLKEQIIRVLKAHNCDLSLPE